MIGLQKMDILKKCPGKIALRAASAVVMARPTCCALPTGLSDCEPDFAKPEHVDSLAAAWKR